MTTVGNVIFFVANPYQEETPGKIMNNRMEQLSSLKKGKKSGRTGLFAERSGPLIGKPIGILISPTVAPTTQ
jgi:hypothetical protein